jgi:hypothetical protein
MTTKKKILVCNIFHFCCCGSHSLTLLSYIVSHREKLKKNHMLIIKFTLFPSSRDRELG